MIQVDISRIDKDMPVVGLDVDLLVAVHISSWFLTEIVVEINVLKILEDISSVRSLYNDALVVRQRPTPTSGVGDEESLQDGDKYQNGALELAAEKDID